MEPDAFSPSVPGTAAVAAFVATSAGKWHRTQ